MTFPRPSRRGALGALVLCALTTGAPRAAAAEDATTPRLAVRRAPSAADCPDAPSLAAAVERMMKRPALTPAGAGDVAPAFEVELRRDGTSYTAVLQAGGRVRQLASEQGAATCDELADALALTIAILLDSEPAPAPPPEAAPAPEAAQVPAPAPTPAPAVPRPPPPLAVPPPPPPPPRLEPSRRWDVSMELGVAQTVGVLDAFRAAAAADVSLRRRAWSVGLGAVWMPSGDIEVAPGAVSVGLTAGMARGCATVAGRLEGLRLSACGASLVGAAHGSGKGFPVDREETVPWFAVSGAALAEGSIYGPLGWSARLMFLVPIVQPRFTVDRIAGSEDDATVATVVPIQPSPVGLLAGVSARLAIW